MSVITVEQRGPARWITLNRPDKLNAINYEMVNALRTEFTSAAQDDNTKILVLTANGRAFSSGYDLSELAEDGISGALAWHKILEDDVSLTMQLWSFPKPTIAAVHGWVLAGGCELAMACDMIIATDKAKFGEPEVKYGSGPATLLMPFIIGQKKTNELLFTGDTIEAPEALALGLINKIVPEEELVDAVNALIRKIAPTPLSTLQLTKIGLIRAAEATGIRQAISANMDVSAILNGSDSPEQKLFDEIVRTDGLKAALAWRDARFEESLTTKSGEDK
jgi:enoyl-CoA hydratase